VTETVIRQVLCHLDKLYLGSGAMLLFKYPLLSRKLTELMPSVKEEIEASEGELVIGDDEDAAAKKKARDE